MVQSRQPPQHWCVLSHSQSGEMREAQQQQLAENRKSSTSRLFQLYWTLTTGLNPNGVINWANGIFKDLFTASGDSQGDVYITSQRGLLRMTTPNSYLNIVTIDNIRDNNVRWLTSLMIGISRLYATCPQVL